jgi:hypothetical protein
MLDRSSKLFLFSNSKLPLPPGENVQLKLSGGAIIPDQIIDGFDAKIIVGYRNFPSFEQKRVIMIKLVGRN